MKVEEHAVVLSHYVLTNNDKEVLDSSEGQDPPCLPAWHWPFDSRPGSPVTG